MQKSEARSQNSGIALICFAMEEEAKAVQWKAFHSECKSLITGIGKQNAERTFRSLLNRVTPQCVFTCGFAGGLNPELKIGDVVFEVPLTPSDGERESAPARMASRLLAAGAKPARFFCADHIAITVAEKQELRRTTGADAVEMESEAIHAVCRERGIPCATVRVISDTAGEDLPLDFNVLANADMSLNYGKLALAIAKSPGKIVALMRFQKKTSFAGKRLAEVLKKVIEPE